MKEGGFIIIRKSIILILYILCLVLSISNIAPSMAEILF